MNENTNEQKPDPAALTDEELAASIAQAQDDAQLREALIANGEAPYLPTDEEMAAIPPAPFLQDFITVPDGGLVFRSTTGKPLLSISPHEDGSRLDLYGAGSAPDVQIVATSAGSIIHFVRQDTSVASVGANMLGGFVFVNQTEGTQGALLGAGAAGGFVYVSNSAGEVTGGLEGTPTEGPPQPEALDPVLLQMMQPRPGEIMH